MKYPLILFLLAAAAQSPVIAKTEGSGVQAPPLPPGSAQVRIQGGLSEPEKQRHIRAHHHKGHWKKDHTRDDSLEPPAANGDNKPKTK